MNKPKLKSYAPNARRDFIQMIRQRADLLGLTKREVAPAKIEGDYAVIEGRPYPKNYAAHHAKVAATIRVENLESFIERIAYSWFNRLAALRFMEINGFLSHGFRVLSNSDASKNEPEILRHAAEIDLAGVDKSKVLELKLAGNKDAELYKILLIAQCNELHRAMPFLFERVGDETEMLLPDNLLASDSVIRKMTAAIDEADWTEVEIIGWLYQFYISEKKDEVIGKTVKSEDIPAATQLFTPNWIVKYMTQNSLGRLWLEANPHSQLAANMEFYIKPADENQTASSNSNINPEEIKVLDPACGSGHILVEAYELLKAIYTERGYSSRDIPLLILENNLFGLDIDERAAQMANFALLMKARRDDRRIFERLNQKSEKQIPNILTVPDSSQLPHAARGIAEMFFSRDASSANAAMPIRADGNFLFDEMQVQRSLVMSDSSAVAVGADSGVSEQNVIDLLELFEQGKTLGSLIRIPHGFGAVVDKLEKAVETKLTRGNVYEQVAARELEPFVRAGRMLAQKYDCVIANPPYMGSKFYNVELKEFVNRNYPEGKADLYGCFTLRNIELCKQGGRVAMLTIPNWMFLSSFESLRDSLLDNSYIETLVHNGRGVFGSDFGSCAYTIAKEQNTNKKGAFKRLFDVQGSVASNDELQKRFLKKGVFTASTNDFKKIPGSPIAYWVSNKVREVFEEGRYLSNVAEAIQGMITGNNEQYLRLWNEVSSKKLALNYQDIKGIDLTKEFWIPYNKGGDLKKWYGNNEFVLNWKNEGRDLVRARTQNAHLYLKHGVTWTFISASFFAARYFDDGFVWDVSGSSAFANNDLDNFLILGLMCSHVGKYILDLSNPTLNYQVENILALPISSKLDTNKSEIINSTKELIEIARADWDSFETSWDFKRLPIADCGLRSRSTSVEECWQTWKNLCDERISRMQELETENNRLFIEAYGLEDELSPEVPLSQITLARADAEKDTRRLLSYFVGCLMGRYSLDQTNLIYADSSGKGFEASNYQTFSADDDGIVPITDMEWFPQEAARQFERFVAVAFGEGRGDAETGRQGDGERGSIAASPRLSVAASQNLQWIAEQLGGKSSETPVETVRRYFSTAFFKDHLQTYKKRPIYWLFSSGKQKAFECLVYLHRYNESTLPRMRHEYVLPLMSKLTAQIELAESLIEKAESTSEKTKLAKQKEIYTKKQTELAAFDEKLRHYSDLRISLDLDDGVKVNYGKFGDLLAEVKQVATTKE